MPPGETRTFLRELKYVLPLELNPAIASLGDWWVRFGVTIPDVPPQTELGALASSTLIRVFGG
jgi:hypothetical protein